MSNARATPWVIAVACAAALATAVHAQGTGTSAAGAWPSYVNQRFSYVLDYPSTLLRPRPEAGNGDGREFHARRGTAVIAVWGEYAQGPTSQREEAASSEPECLGGKATYRLSRPTVQVTSCVLAKGGILYWYSQQRKDIIVTLSATYPASEKPTWDPVVRHMIRSFHLSDSEL